MPPLILSIVEFIQLAIKTAPAVQQVYADGRNLISSLFSAQLITAEQQAALMNWCDDLATAALNGAMPPEFQVQQTVTDQVKPATVVSQAEAPAPAPAPLVVSKDVSAPDPTQNGTLTPQDKAPAPAPDPAPAPTPDPAPAAEEAPKVVCPQCGQELIPNHPANCSCVN